MDRHGDNTNAEHTALLFGEGASPDSTGRRRSNVSKLVVTFLVTGTLFALSAIALYSSKTFDSISSGTATDLQVLKHLSANDREPMLSGGPYTPMLCTGDSLYVGSFLMSDNLEHILSPQSNGNLIIFTRYGVKEWESYTARFMYNKGHRLSMQADCDLVYYGLDGTALWRSFTSGRGSLCYFTLLDNRELAILNGNNQLVWHTNIAKRNEAVATLKKNKETYCTPTAKPTARPTTPTAKPTASPTVTPTVSAEDEYEESDKDFCWRNSYGRGVGTIPNVCDDGKTLDGGLCYDKCSQGYSGLGITCYEDCTGSYENFGCCLCNYKGSPTIGTLCLDSAYPQNFGGLCYADGVREHEWTPPASNRCSSGSFNWGGVCYEDGVDPWKLTKFPNYRTYTDGCCSRGLFNECWGCVKTDSWCPDHYHGWGGMCYANEKGYMELYCDRKGYDFDGRLSCVAKSRGGSCPADYYFTGLTCQLYPDKQSKAKASYVRGAGTIPTRCGSDKENQSGLCYKSCDRGFSGNGPVCWGTCPRNGDMVGMDAQIKNDWEECGMGCAKDKQTCGFALADQILGPIQAAAQITALIVSGGTSAVGVSAAKMGKNAAKILKIAKKIQKYTEKLAALKDYAEKVADAIEAGKPQPQTSADLVALAAENPELDPSKLYNDLKDDEDDKSKSKKPRKASKKPKGGIGLSTLKAMPKPEKDPKMDDIIKKYYDNTKDDLKTEIANELEDKAKEEFKADASSCDNAKESANKYNLAEEKKRKAFEKQVAQLGEDMAWLIADTADPTGLVGCVEAFKKPKCDNLGLAMTISDALR